MFVESVLERTRLSGPRKDSKDVTWAGRIRYNTISNLVMADVHAGMEDATRE